jgi:microcin C transport system permease protein
MRDYFLRRFLLIPPTLLGITLIVFLITRVVPGGPIERALMEARMGDAGGAQTNQIGSGAISEEQMAQLKAYYGFDRPPLEAYLLWLGKVVRGDIGNSYRYNEPVLHIIADRLPVSLLYGLVTTLLVYGVCIPLGIVKAVRHRTWIDNVSSAVVFTGYAIPGYALGALLVVYLSARLGWFPMQTQSWIELLLSLPIVLWAGLPFFVRGWQSVVHRSPNMWPLIATGTGAAPLTTPARPRCNPLIPPNPQRVSGA